METSQIGLEVIMSQLFNEENKECTVMKRDPHESRMIAIGVDEQVGILDTRKEAKSVDITFDAHSDQVFDVAYNASRLHTLATCGSDGAVRIWDTRKPDRSILCFDDDYSGHFVTKIRYNQFHDQLLLTGSTSTFASLYRASSVSTSPSPGQYGYTDLNNTNTFNMSIGDLSATNASISIGGTSPRAMNNTINTARSATSNNPT